MFVGHSMMHFQELYNLSLVISQVTTYMIIVLEVFLLGYMQLEYGVCNFFIV